MQFVRNFVKADFSVNILLENSYDFVLDSVGIFDFGNKYLRGRRLGRFFADKFNQQFFEIVRYNLRAAYVRVGLEFEFLKVGVEFRNFKGVFRFAHYRGEKIPEFVGNYEVFVPEISHRFGLTFKTYDKDISVRFFIAFHAVRFVGR